MMYTRERVQTETGNMIYNLIRFFKPHTSLNTKHLLFVFKIERAICNVGQNNEMLKHLHL